jgi:Flp pilus assembly protein TadD
MLATSTSSYGRIRSICYWVARTCIALAVSVLFAPFQIADAGDTPKQHEAKIGSASPYLPSQAKSTFTGFLSPDQFPKAEYCAKCHEDVHKEWRQSAHSNAFRNPFYIKNVNNLIDTKGIEYTRHCEGCHNPIALFSGALSNGSKVNRSFDDDGITCMTCHSIAKVQNTSGTGSYVMGVPAVMVTPDGSPVTHPVSYDEILQNPKLHSRAVMKDFYRKPEFCAVCHKAAVPKLLNEYKWLRAFSAYDEWQQSSWAKESPLPFYRKDTVSTCQTCHMPPVDATTDYGAKKGKAVSHRWLGASTTIPMIYGYDQQLQKVIAYLKDDLLGIDFFSVSKNSGGKEEVVAPLGRQAFRLASGDDVTLSVVIQNKKIGHSLVPEQRDFYESWVEFQVTDAQGNSIAHSGFLTPKGTLDERSHTYSNRLISKQSELLGLHEVWQTRIRAFDNSILPGRSDLVRYRFRIPEGTVGPLNVVAKVNYRRFRQEFTYYVFPEHKTFPVVELVTKSTILQIGDNPAETTPDDKEWMRWNNYGIALLDQRQYAPAVRAFEHVVQLRKDYADGYTNVGIANLSYQRYSAALDALHKALEISPDDPRAIFYEAMILRLQGKLEEAVSSFKRVLLVYPRFRQARQELGYSYYQQKQYNLAREQYEALQDIDPDDLSAHYNLMIIYGRLGMKAQSAEQAALFADRKDDPGATALAQDYLRKHNEFSSESVPWHVHLAGPPVQRNTSESRSQ